MSGILEFLERHGSEADCIEALARLRWPQGYVCARCGERRNYQLKTRPRGLRMRRLRPSGIGDRGHGLPPHPHTVAQMVPGGVVDGARQARGLGAVSVARVEPALRHRLADGPQAAPCPDGAPGVPAGGLGRGRRELLRAGGASRRAGGAGFPTRTRACW